MNPSGTPDMDDLAGRRRLEPNDAVVRRLVESAPALTQSDLGSIRRLLSQPMAWPIEPEEAA